MRASVALVGVLAAGCATTNADYYETCTLSLTPEVPSGLPGSVVTLTGEPLTEVYDTVVEVGGVPAQVLSVERSAECETCDLCRGEAECLSCGPCLATSLEDSRRVECFGDPFDDAATGICAACTQSLTFTVPPLPAGPTQIVVLNRNGGSPPLPFVVLAAADTGGTGHTGDTGHTGGTADTAITIIVPTAHTGSLSTGVTGSTADTGLLTGSTAHTGAPPTADTALFDTATTGGTGVIPDTASTADTAGTSTADTGLSPTGGTADTGPT